MLHASDRSSITRAPRISLDDTRLIKHILNNIQTQKKSVIEIYCVTRQIQVCGLIPMYTILVTRINITNEGKEPGMNDLDQRPANDLVSNESE